MDSSVFRIWQRGRHGERAEREPITGVWGRSPSGVQGQSTWWGVRGRSPPEAETLFAFKRSIEAANSPIFSEICWKTAKNAPFDIKSLVKNFHDRAKGGGIAPCPPLNTPLKL